MTLLYKIELSKRLMQVKMWDCSVFSTLPFVLQDEPAGMTPEQAVEYTQLQSEKVIKSAMSGAAFTASFLCDIRIRAK
jgi:hypothetical protein